MRAVVASSESCIMNDGEKLTKLVYSYTTTPHFADACGHGGYLFSFSVVEREGASLVEGNYDVYCFVTTKQEFCLRFGNDDADYCSPGNIVNIINASKLLERYKALLELLMCHGSIIYQPDEMRETTDTDKCENNILNSAKCESKNNAM